MIYRFDRGIDRQWRKKGTVLAGALIAVTVPAVTALALRDSPNSNQGTFGVNGITITRGPITEDNTTTTDTGSSSNGEDASETSPDRDAAAATGSTPESSTDNSRSSSSASTQQTQETSPARGGEGPQGGTPPSNNQDDADDCLCETVVPDPPITEQTTPPEQGTLEDLLDIEDTTSSLQNTMQNTTNALTGL